MTKMLVAAALSAAALLGLASGALAERPAPKDENLVLNIGHRGASGHAPEHTIPAYDLALRQGADYIEHRQFLRSGLANPCCSSSRSF